MCVQVGGCTAEQKLYTGPVGATPEGGTGAAGEPSCATGSTAVHGSAGTDLSKGEKSSMS